MVSNNATLYYEHPAISQSQLKMLLGNPAKWNNEQESEFYYEEKKHFIIGSAVDCLLTESVQEFNNRYHVSEVPNKPSDAMKSIINQIFDEVKEIEGHSNEIGVISNYPHITLDACNSHAYQSRWGDQLRISKVCEYWQYWEDLKQSQGKQILSQEEHLLIYQIVMSIQSHVVVGFYFAPSNYVDILYQLPIFFEYSGVDCKALLDMVYIDHVNKTIQPIDIKTVGDYVLNFPKSIRQRRYDIQAAFYLEALQYKQREMGFYPDYKILPFKFIVQSSTHVGEPVIFTCDTTLLEIGKHGRKELYTTIDGVDDILISYKIVGFNELIDLYKYHTIAGFDAAKVITDNRYDLIVDWSGIL